MKNYPNKIDTEKKIEAAISQLIAYLESYHFEGWEPYDSPDFKWIPLKGIHSIRVFLTQLFRLSPLFLHRYFKSEKRHAKAVTLFTRAFLNLYEITKEQLNLERALNFLEWLQTHRSAQSKNYSIGNQYQLSMKAYAANPDTPAPLITCFAIEAFISAYEILQDHSYLALATSGINYFLEELPLIKLTRDQWYFVYHPNHRQFIPNLPAVVSGTLARFYVISKQKELLPVIRHNLNSVVKCQREDGSWFYYPGSNYIDSFHTAFILEALVKYHCYTGDNSFEPAFLKGLTYYINSFFKSNGQPIHKKRSGFPTNLDSFLTQIDLRDIAMGLSLFSVLTACKKYVPAPLVNLLSWSLDHFRSSEGFFYYQRLPIYLIKGPFLTMQAWMLYSLSHLKKAFICQE